MAVQHQFLCCRSNQEGRKHKMSVKPRSTGRVDKAAWCYFPETDKSSQQHTKHMKSNSSLTKILEYMEVDLYPVKDTCCQQDIADKNSH